MQVFDTFFRTRQVLQFKQLNDNWNADPNAPEPRLTVTGHTVQLEFSLKAFLFEQFQEGNKAYLTFQNCHKYAFTALNDEGYHRGLHRYNSQQLPWGEFYELFTNWQIDFSEEPVVLEPVTDTSKLHHYIFFLRDNTLECVAEGWQFERV